MKYRGPLVGNFGSTWRTIEGCLALVTYFKRKRSNRKLTVEFFKMIGDKVVAKGEIDCPYIPIICFKGEDIYRKGKKINVGIVDKSKYPQKTINYANSQLRERLAKVPKPILLAGKSAVQGNEEYYENMDKSFNPLIMFNDINSNGQPIAPPTKIDNSVVTGDLTGVIDANINYMSLIIGMPSTGLTGTVGAQETAESVMMRSRSSESNQSHYYENAKVSVKQIGRILLHFIKQSTGIEIKGLEVEVNDGPELITKRDDERKTLLAFSQAVPDNIKIAILPMLAKTLDIQNNEQLSKSIELALPPELKTGAPTEDPQAKAIMDEMSQQVDQFKQMYEQQLQTTNQLQAALFEMQNDSRTKLIIAEMNNRASLQEVIIKEKAEDSRLAAKILVEADQKILELQNKDSTAKLEIETGGQLFNKSKFV